MGWCWSWSSNELAVIIRWPKYWSFSFSISPSNKYSGLISFMTDLISLQSKGLARVLPALQFKSISSSAFNLPYGPTLISIHDYWKNHSFDYMDLCQQSNLSLLFNTLSRLVKAFELPLVSAYLFNLVPTLCAYKPVYRVILPGRNVGMERLLVLML